MNILYKSRFLAFRITNIFRITFEILPILLYVSKGKIISHNMNIFIDTSTLTTDPFFNEIHKKEILKACKEGQLNLFLSEVVVKELIYNYNKNLDKINLEIIKVNTNSDKLIPDFKKFELLNNTQLASNLEKFYSELTDLENFNILPVSNAYLPIILDKAIKRQKPFTEKKTELKDALIWQTYIDHINQNGLKDCYLLTANVNDFGLKQGDGSHVIHPELQKECTNIELVIEFKEVLKKYKEAEKTRTLSWMDIGNISEEFVFEIISNDYQDKVRDNIVAHLDRINIDKYFSEGYLIRSGGYVDLIEETLLQCDGIEIEISNDIAIISGSMDVSGNVEAYSYNSVRDPGDDKYSSVGEMDIIFVIYFNLVLDKDGSQDFQITSIDDEAG